MIDSVFRAEKQFNVLFLEGLVTLVNRFGSYGVEWTSHEDNFSDFLELQEMTGKSTKKMTYPNLRKDNHYGISVAWGLYQDYFDWCKHNGKAIPFAKKRLQEDYNNAGMAA
mgnify:CR=1 FL=1